ncbi:putative membrane protein [Clostridium bornimense]|uniref:Putative membrane protein n=1 Tax=Clostridium bornimense TaxID=1216932 RepID=W6S2U6_9CLOT|nr:DUF6020 family protein [Clostridium bornimense]CDM70234.1 putative membrane protein [Clostridium bornimense]
MNLKDKIKMYLLALFTTLAICLDPEKFYGNLTKIQNPFKVGLMTVCIISGGLILFYKAVRGYSVNALEKIVSMAFAIFMTLGFSYARMNSWQLVFGSFRMFFISIIICIGYYVLFKRIFDLINIKIQHIKVEDYKLEKMGKLRCVMKFIDERPFLSSLLIIITFWLIYIIAFYPVILSPDPSFQIKQFFNVDTKYAEGVIKLDENVNITNHHPVVHTLLLGGCISLGRFIGSDNFGLFIYSMIQIGILASTLSYTIKYLKKVNISLKVRLILLMIYSIVPMFPFYAMSAVKDTIYTSFMILYVIFLYDFITFNKEKKITNIKVIYIILLLFLISLFRNNGIYVVMLSFPFIIGFSKKNRIKTLAVFAIFISLTTCYSKVILPYFKIANGSIREMLSIPFQQTARYVKYYGDEVSEEDKRAIDKILIYDTIAERYQPELADPVKNKYNKYATSDDLKEYFKAWFRGLRKHPGIYIEATINNVYGYFYPNAIKWYTYHKFDCRITKDNLVDYSYNNLQGLRDKLVAYQGIFPYVPFIGLISNIGFNTWILLIMGVYLFTFKKKEYIIVLMPLYASVLICIASPANTYFRYAMPYIFSNCVLIPLLLNSIARNKL